MIVVKLALIALFVFLALFILNRYICSPRFTNRARRQFIIDILKSKDFVMLSQYHEETYIFEGRKVKAHWSVHRCKSSPCFILEFDVHPSKFPITISASEFIFIKDQAHFNEMRKSISSSNDYDPFLATVEQFTKMWD